MFSVAAEQRRAPRKVNKRIDFLLLVETDVVKLDVAVDVAKLMEDFELGYDL